MIWQKAAAIGCILLLILWILVSGRLYVILESSLPVAVVEFIPRLKSEVVCVGTQSPCYLYATLDALPTNAQDDPVITIRAISSTDMVSGTARVRSRGNGEPSEVELSFRPPAPGRYLVYARVEYGSRRAALADPVGTDAGPAYLGTPVGGTPVRVLVTRDKDGHGAEKGVCGAGTAEGYWSVDGGAARRQFTGQPKCGQGRAVWRGYGCEYPALSARTVRKVLAAWDIYMIGDSVTRQMLDALAEGYAGAVPLYPRGSKEEAAWRALVPVHENDRNPRVSNPRKIEVPKLFNATQTAGLKQIINTHRFKKDRSVAVVNFGLHDAAYGTLARYADLLEDALRAIRKAGFAHIIWRSTSAIHPVVLGSKGIRPQHRHFTSARVEELNRRASEVVAKLNAERYGAPILVLDMYAMTKSREDGVKPGDMRHYCADVMVNTWAVLFSMLMPTTS